LRERAVFHNVLDIKNPEILSRVHLNYRLQFLKDTAAARWIEEQTAALVNEVPIPP
jgi:hypothetical protein